MSQRVLTIYINAELEPFIELRGMSIYGAAKEAVRQYRVQHGIHEYGQTSFPVRIIDEDGNINELTVSTETTLVVQVPELPVEYQMR
jgi:hypothetical protein